MLRSENIGQKLVIVLPFVVLLVIGIESPVLAEAGPIGWALLVATGYTGLMRLSMPDRYSLSKAAKSLLRTVTLAGAGGLVALGGLEAFPDPVVAAALGPSAKPNDGGSTNGCGGDSGCGGGCGGGD